MSSRIRQLWDIVIHGRSDASAPIAAARSDAQYRLPGELADDTTGKVKPPTYVDFLVKNDIRDHANSEHRNLVAQYDPHAKLWVYDIALNVWDDGFEFVDMEGNTLDEMDVVQDELRRLRFKEIMMHRATPEERKHGWSLVYKVYDGAKNAVVEGESLEGDWMHFMGDKHAYSSSIAPKERPIRSLQPLPTGDLMVVTCDRFNQPELVRYTPAYPEDEAPVGGHKFSILIHASRFWWLVPRPLDRSWKGATSLAGIWSVLVAMREILDNIGSYAGKYGAGLLKIGKKGPTNDALSDEITEAVKNVSKRRHFLYNTQAIESVEWESPNLSEHGPEGMLEACYGMLAGGTGLPKTRWYGAQAGNLEGSRTNLKLEWGVISAIQASYEPIIRAIVEDLFPDQFSDYTIQWKLEAQMDDMEKAELLNMRATAAGQLATVATRREIRKIVELPDKMEGKTVAEEQQEALTGLMEKSGQPSQSPSEGDKPAPKASSAPASPSRSDAKTAMKEGRFPAFVAYWEALGWSRNRIIQASEIGRGTFYKYMGQEMRTSELRL